MKCFLTSAIRRTIKIASTASFSNRIRGAKLELLLLRFGISFFLPARVEALDFTLCQMHSQMFLLLEAENEAGPTGPSIMRATQDNHVN